MSWVRLGDVDLAASGVIAARADHLKALSTTADLFLSNPTPELRREVTWSLRKLGEVETSARQPAQAAAFYGDVTCLRRSIAAADEDDDLAKRDLAFVLESLGKAEAEAGMSEAHDALIESFALRDGLVRSDRGNFAYGLEKAQTLATVADLYRRQGAPLKWLGDARGARDLIDDLLRRSDDGARDRDVRRANALAQTLDATIAEAHRAVSASPDAAQHTDRWIDVDAEVAVLADAKGRTVASDCLPGVERHIRVLVDQVGSTRRP